jgi:hypothetical protein
MNFTPHHPKKVLVRFQGLGVWLTCQLSLIFRTTSVGHQQLFVEIAFVCWEEQVRKKQVRNWLLPTSHPSNTILWYTPDTMFTCLPTSVGYNNKVTVRDQLSFQDPYTCTKVTLHLVGHLEPLLKVSNWSIIITFSYSYVYRFKVAWQCGSFSVWQGCYSQIYTMYVKKIGRITANHTSWRLLAAPQYTLLEVLPLPCLLSSLVAIPLSHRPALLLGLPLSHLMWLPLALPSHLAALALSHLIWLPLNPR